MNFTPPTAILAAAIAFAVVTPLRSQTNTLPSSGNVGIGTTTPDHALTVTGGSYPLKVHYAQNADLLFGTGNGIGATGMSITAINDGETALQPIQLRGSTVIFNDGSVGIGTTNPGYRLEVDGIANSYTSLFQANMTSGQSYGPSINAGTNSSDQALVINNAAGSLTHLVVRGDGNIGIGTTSPGYKVDVQGTVSVGTIASGGDLRIEGMAGNSYPWNIKSISTGLDFVSDNGIGLVAFLDNGNVGIGRTNPQYTLDIQNTNGPTQSRLSSNGLNNQSVVSRWQNDAGSLLIGREQVNGGSFLNGSADHAGVMEVEGNYPIQFGTNYNVRMTINGSGNVGIGTTTPTALLHMYRATSDSSGLQVIQNGHASNNAAFTTYANASGSLLIGKARSTGGSIINGEAGYAGVIGTDTAYPLQLATNGAIAMTILSAGNVGIGTTSPGAKLDVAGNANIQGNMTATGNVSAVNVTATGIFSAAGATSFTATGTTTFAGPISATSATFSGVVSSGTINSASGNLTVSSAGTSNNLLLNPSGGNVGIGTNSPGARLHIVGAGLGSAAGSTTSLLSLQNTNANSSFLNVFETRNVAGSDWNSATTRIQQVTDVTAQGYIDFNPVGGTYGLAFGSQSSEYVRIQNGGNVGIGTTNPTQKLSVNGTIQAKEVIVQTGWSDYVFDPKYPLVPLSEVERQIKEQGHLPGIPSAQEVAEHGVRTGEMEAKLLAKVEELTLHVIEQNKELIDQNRRLTDQMRQLIQESDRIDRLEKENASLRTSFH